MTVRDLIRVLDSDTSVVLTPRQSVIDENTKWYRNTAKIPQEELDRRVLEVSIETMEDVSMFWIYVK